MILKMKAKECLKALVQSEKKRTDCENLEPKRGTRGSMQKQKPKGYVRSSLECNEKQPNLGDSAVPGNISKTMYNANERTEERWS